MLWVSAAWPALLLAYAGDVQWTMDAWMLGGYWELNALSRPWLAFTALLWSMAAFHARGYFADEQRQAQGGNASAQRRLQRLTLLWPLTLLGNILLIVAQDIASFYFGFALMTFAAYALVVHNGTPAAKLGAKAYLVLAVIGEGLILGGFLWAAGTSDTLTLKGVRDTLATADHGAWMALLLWLGLGVGDWAACLVTISAPRGSRARQRCPQRRHDQGRLVGLVDRVAVGNGVAISCHDAVWQCRIGGRVCSSIWCGPVRHLAVASKSNFGLLQYQPNGHVNGVSGCGNRRASGMAGLATCHHFVCGSPCVSEGRSLYGYQCE
jgi:hypothetical protein